jgi:hypothetical protein
LLKDIPENPQGFQHLYENLTESSITVQWIPGFDGGPRQTFVLRYKTNSDMFWTDINISDNGEKNMSYTVTSLTSGTLYNFVLYARNKIGNSSQTAVLGIRTGKSAFIELSFIYFIIIFTNDIWLCKIDVRHIKNLFCESLFCLKKIYM